MFQHNQDSESKYPRFSHLGEISIEVFLKEYWQKKPLLIRKAFKDFKSPISADELAGFSLDDDVVSRLIIEQSSNSQSDYSWSVEHGPIDENRYSELPEKQWTLLVQHADSLDPNINEILNAFRFISNWRLDDIMVSYATDQGGVGPHFDYFDVFLLQAQGKRRWRIGQRCDSSSELIPNQAMKILSEFDTNEDWVCEPGDLLYIPAQIAHWGEAIGESMTYSIGFRAPSDTELLLDFSQHLAAPLCEDNRYTDKSLESERHTGEISETVLNNFQNRLSTLINNKYALASWLAEYSTTQHNHSKTEKVKNTRSDTENVITDSFNLYEVATSENCDGDSLLKLAPFNRCVFLPESISKKNTEKLGNNYETENGKRYTECYINGTSYLTTIRLAEILASYDSFSLSSLDSQEQEFMQTIIAEKYIMLID